LTCGITSAAPGRNSAPAKHPRAHQRSGEVQLKELSLVRNKSDETAWVIAPEDVSRILKLRNAPSQEQPKK
jgi:hypothetical protein